MTNKKGVKKSQLYNLTALDLSFFICKMGTLITILPNLTGLLRTSTKIIQENLVLKL